jgi:UDP-2-acetamido-2,6-beta-L-arabino-hexul-4-ose reductase
MSPRVVLVTGAKGFIGKNLCSALGRRTDLQLVEFDVKSSKGVLDEALAQADVVVHLAGVNRPPSEQEFEAGNAGFTSDLLEKLQRLGRLPKVFLSSSIQAELQNPYGKSKLGAEVALQRYCEATGAEGVVFRFKNLFGKWCRPNYNSVVATFCNNIANGLPVQVSNPANLVNLTYIDDVVAALLAELDAPLRPGFRMANDLPSHAITLGELVATIQAFHAHRDTLVLPSYASAFTRALYATYLSYLPPAAAAYQLTIRADDRGSLAEFVKSPHFGQVFVSRTRPGITRGNHFHQTKTEKFLVVQGEAAIRLRQIHGGEVVAFRVRGEEYRVVDILPGYTHSIENVGSGELVTLFWSSEVFDQAKPDTLFDPVIPPRAG